LESQPLGTIGPLKLIHDLPDNFLLMNGDILTDLDFRDFFNFHIKQQNLFTISAYQREVPSEFGVLELDDSGRMTGFKEKPVIRYDVSMGVYMVSRDVLSYIPADQAYGFDNLMIDLISDKHPAAVKKFDGYWLDIGRSDDYSKAIDEFEILKGRFLR
jgi:NDP-sugar pyrophosphorylase family protein